MKQHILLSVILLAMSLSTYSQTIDKPKINHIAVFVQNLDTCTKFYRDVIGLEVIPEPFHDGRHTWFSIGEHAALHLIQGAEKVEEHLKDSHLCFSVPSIEKFMAVLKENKISFESWAGEQNNFTLRADGIKQIYFKDPEGYWIEVNNDW